MQDVRAKPDFLCVGTPKCGSTWLHRNIGNHPEIWLPPIKELHYFDGLQIKEQSRQANRNNKENQMRWKRQASSHLRDIVPYPPNRRTIRRALWLSKYFFLPRTNRWYLSLFPDDPGLVCGEIAPSYCWLNERSIERVQTLNPDLRVIFLIRDPVQRAWSHAMMHFRNRLQKKHVSLSSIDSNHLSKFFVSNRNRVGKYRRNLNRWRRFFPDSQLLVADLVQISKDPERFLSSVYTFLGVDRNQGYNEAAMFAKSMTGSYDQIPDEWNSFLANLYIRETRWRDRFLQQVAAGNL